jgi:hypothetical protein
MLLASADALPRLSSACAVKLFQPGCNVTFAVQFANFLPVLAICVALPFSEYKTSATPVLTVPTSLAVPETLIAAVLKIDLLVGEVVFTTGAVMSNGLPLGWMSTL